MPRHTPDVPPRAEPAPAGRRLSAAVGAGTGAAPGTADGTAPGPAAARGLFDGPPPDARPMAPGGGGSGDPPAPSRFRWRTGRQAAGLLCLVCLGLLGCFWWQSADSAAEVSALSSVQAAEPGAVPDGQASSEAPNAGEPAVGDTGKDPGGRIVVHVAGAVQRAGIVELERGSRLHQAIAAAGGSAPGADPDQLNLASVLEDGQKIVVPRQGETLPPAAAPAAGAGSGGADSGGAAAGAAAGKINLNTAGAGELASLPRVGPVLAQRIVDWRSEHGAFRRIEELDAVEGFGPKLLESVLPLVRV